jgi:hypothetical protein
MSTLKVDTIQNVAGVEQSRLVQVVKTSLSTKSTGTTAIPPDTSIPQNDEGDQYMTVSITPTNTNNILYVTVNIGMFGGNAAVDISHCIFNSNVHATNALATTTYYQGDANNSCGTAHLNYHCLASDANGTSATTFTLRGGQTSGTYTICGYANAAQFGVSALATMTVMEVRA